MYMARPNPLWQIVWSAGPFHPQLVSSGDPEDGASASPRTRSAGASAQTGDGDAAWGPVKHHVRTFKASLLDKYAAVRRRAELAQCSALGSVRGHLPRQGGLLCEQATVLVVDGDACHTPRNEANATHLRVHDRAHPPLVHNLVRHAYRSAAPPDCARG